MALRDGFSTWCFPLWEILIRQKSLNPPAFSLSPSPPPSSIRSSRDEVALPLLPFMHAYVARLKMLAKRWVGAGLGE